MRTLHLFAGGGGGLLADLILGHEPVCAVEIDPYCCRVLRERAAEGWFPNLSVWEGDVRLFDPSPWAGGVDRCDAVIAGFPCQDLSLAGKRAGIHGERSGLFFEVVRIVRLVRPRYVFLENVPGVLPFLGTINGELAALGYDARWTCLSAAAVGANHKRERWWCLATYSGGPEQRRGNIEERGPARRVPEPARDGATRILADSGSARRQQIPGGPHGDEGQDEGRAENKMHEPERDGEGDRAGPLAHADNGHQREEETIRAGRDTACACGENLADAARIQPGREEQRAERERIGESCEHVLESVSDAEGISIRAGLCPDEPGGERWGRPGNGGGEGEFPYPLCWGLQGSGAEPTHGDAGEGDQKGNIWWGVEPDVGRVAHGVASRVDRLKALGNGQVPLQAAVAWRLLGGAVNEIPHRPLVSGA